MRKVKIALVQADFPFGDLQGNVAKAEEYIRNAAKKHADLILLPESFNRGYSFIKTQSMIEWSETLEGETVTAMRSIAKELCVCVLAPLLIRTKSGACENTAVLIGDSGEIIGTYSKTHLVPGSEKELIRPGTEYPVFETRYGKIGILICFDLAFPESAQHLSENGADLIIFTAAWRHKKGGDEDSSYGGAPNPWDVWLQARALENSVYIAAVDRVGVVDQTHFYGGSKIIDPQGRILASSTFPEETLVICEIQQTE